MGALRIVGEDGGTAEDTVDCDCDDSSVGSEGLSMCPWSSVYIDPSKILCGWW